MAKNRRTDGRQRIARAA